MITDFMTSNALQDALLNVFKVCESGKSIYLIKTISRDEFGEPVSEESLELKSFPVRYAPFSREVRDKLTWAKDIDIICYISKKAVDDIEFDYNFCKGCGICANECPANAITMERE